MRRKIPVSFMGVFVLTLATLYFFYEFFLRVIMGTIASQLMTDLHIGAEKFAFIGSAYYLTYSIMQTPVGILVDRFGVKLLLTLACIVCNIGVIAFAFADSFSLALIGRFLIGFGSSFAFVSILILALNWFPRDQFGFLVGLIQFLGSVGPFLAGAPLAHFVEATGSWRTVLLWIVSFGIVLNVFLAIFVKTAPKGKAKEKIFLTKLEPLQKKLKELFRNRQVWVTIFFSGFNYAALPLLGAFWGTSYLKSRGFTTQMSAFLISMIWLGLAVGSPLVGKISDLMKRRRVPLILFSFSGALTSLGILYLPIQSEIILAILFFLIGIASSAIVVSFALISEHVPRKLHATAIGLNNTVITFFGSLIPPIVSFLIQSVSPVGATEFSESAFKYGFFLIPLLYLLAFFLSLFALKETFCRQQHEVFLLEKQV